MLTSCLACEDTPVVAYRLLATLQADRGSRPQARETLQRGVRRFSSNALLWVALGRLEIALERHRGGISALGTAHRLKPNDAGLEEEYRNALAQYGSEEDRVEANIHPLILEATGRFELGDRAGALAVLQSALKTASPIPRLLALVHHRLGLVHLADGQIDKARVAHEKALGNSPPESELRSDILVSYSEILVALGHLQEAGKRAQEAIRLAPRNPLAHANLGIAESLRKRTLPAVEALGNAFRFGLARRLTRSEFFALGEAINRLRGNENFELLLKEAWPRSPKQPSR